METFVFSSRAKATTGGLAIFGLILLVLSYFVDGGEGHHMRFWTNLLHNSVFFLGIGALAGFAYCAFTTAYAGWFVQFKRVWESFWMFLLPGLFLMGIIIVGLWMHSHHMYHWNDAAAVADDAILTHKSSFLNAYWYTGASILFVGVWYFMLGRIRSISIDEDANGTTAFEHHARIKKYAAPFLVIFGFTSAALIWQWIMSLDSHWYSTMFAWYATASLFVAMMALTIMLLIYLKSRGYYTGITAEHFHDMGKYLFAISIFWTYLWFSQYMLIWYGNVGEETIYFRERMDNYPVLFWTNLGINFLLPFFVLMRNDTKRKAGTLFFAAAFVFFGHWLDYFQMIKPGARLTLIEMEHHDAHGGHGEEHATMDGHGADHSEDHASVDGHGDDHDIVPGESTDHATNRTEADPAGEDHAYDNHNIEQHPDAVESNIPVAANNNHGPGGDHNFTDLVTASDGEEHLSPSAEFKSGYTLPGLLEIGIFLGFLGGFLFFVLSKLQEAPLEPKRDPYFEESLHHHT
ncbi:hypothetical protein [Lewinella sp. 4G2]|uniref:hypothetical protein n=1 Tax=Lewinella sp. 4G2 TaxID=1803372 RepID=UPI0007B481B3|nr:hypothetical protein [Lewinella sp. 4G2]OAV44991.1 hypothetical protein A3850_011035 [Lewinella sp. 4G2]